MSRVKIQKEIIEPDKKVMRKSTLCRVLNAFQIGILIIGIFVFFSWCGAYLSQDYEIESNSYDVAEALTELKAEHKEDADRGMLPKSIIPHQYNLTLQLFMPPNNFTTNGNVQMLIECVKETKVIILHARTLTIDAANLTWFNESSSNNKTYTTEIKHERHQQMVFISLNEPLEPQSRYILDVSFRGLINNLSVGLYRSSYLSENGNISWIASTQFQPSDARRVFPCLDEPSFKATFRLNLIVAKDSPALSNMPEISRESLDDEWDIVSFDETPRMSTYILSFVVGEIKSYSLQREEGVQIWSRNDMAEYGERAQLVTPIMLKFLEEYIEVPFTLPKLDLVSVPSFLHAAMENWGLIIFDEAALLYNPEQSSTENKVFVTVVIAHELGHQWFGNLVTPAWWDNIWLNEGFATYYEYLAVDNLEPEWGIMHVFIATVYEVMETDSLLTTRAMGSPVRPEAVLDSFDEISYLKGGAIVRMLQHFIGEQGFRKGLKNYLWRFSYKSATENNLWQNLNLWNKNKIGVKQAMNTWTSQSGYPVVKFDRDYDNNTALITQKPFILDLDDNEIVKFNDRLWHIPITYTHGEELDWSTKPDFWLTTKSDTLKNLPNESTWIIANAQQVGYYRVNYDTRNWELLLEQLLTNHTEIEVINRAQILNDILNLARSDETEYAMALNITKYLFLEEEYLPWQAAFSAFKHLDVMLAKQPGHDEFKHYILAIMSPLYNRIGWSTELEEDNIQLAFLRKNILKWNCNYDNPDCVKTAQNLFNEWKEGDNENKTLSADDKEIVLCTGIARGPTEDWEIMWKRYLVTNFKPEKNILLKSLACTRETRLLRRLLKRAMDSYSGIPLQDGSDVFSYVAENFYGRDIVYDFFKNHMDEISFRFGSFPFTGGKNIVDSVTASLNRENEIEELQSLLKGRKTAGEGIHKALRIAVDRTKSNLRWMNTKYSEVYDWLKEIKLYLQ
ncbi:hypothetical protein JTE90_028752 [Oedothorax gibbosus]|uniref:Aminopeptidase n=1 Tax=Oedothorax gibbosus TaxID=931172 RepID=A0AAV6VY91_9ARAC|nr:hypothetical protein JTE90_028752 [Oedothorax gibbosus]